MKKQFMEKVSLKIQPHNFKNIILENSLKSIKIHGIALLKFFKKSLENYLIIPTNSWKGY